MSPKSLAIISLVLLAYHSNAAIINFQTDVGAVPDDFSEATAWKNGGLMNVTLATMEPGDTLVIPNTTFYMMGGILSYYINSVTIQIDGTILYSNDIHQWPRNAEGDVLECMNFEYAQNLTFTSSGKGTINGNGGRWWGIPLIGYAVRAENRPRLLNIGNSSQILVENILFKQSPYWTVWIHGVDGLEIRWSDVDNRRNNADRHSDYDLTAFNTDGFDITGRNVWVHDCSVWNQDDCFCVKDGSENMLFERINASGLGLTIGSISGTVVRNITFRDVYMPHTYKGIYMKFRQGETPGLIADVLYENVYIDEPEQWAIWMGPAQQSDSADLCAPHPCSLCWPRVPGAECNMPAAGSYENITLRNITIANPKRVGVIIANATNPMKNVLFDSVRVIDTSKKQSDYSWFECVNVENAVATGDTWPVPPCFVDNTNAETESESEVYTETLTEAESQSDMI